MAEGGGRHLCSAPSPLNRQAHSQHRDREACRPMFAGSAATSTIARRPRVGATAPGYVPRHPIDTLLHAIVRDHLETFLDRARQNYARGLPRYVEQASRDYLACGVFAHGFLRLHCDDCRPDPLVALSCQGRGLCPSCAGRSMANTAAHLVDRVLPAVPVRKGVLSLPFELRNLASFRADVARAIGRIFIEAVALEQKRAAGMIGGSQHATANHAQRFGGSLNLNLHFHAIIADSVFATNEAGHIYFYALAPPARDMLEGVVRRIRDRGLRWLRKRGLLDERPDEDRSNAQPAPRSVRARRLPFAAARSPF